MTKEEFKEIWDDEDSEVTWDEIAECALQWGLFSSPRAVRMDRVANEVTKAANCEHIYKLWEE